MELASLKPDETEGQEGDSLPGMPWHERQLQPGTVGGSSAFSASLSKGERQDIFTPGDRHGEGDCLCLLCLLTACLPAWEAGISSPGREGRSWPPGGMHACAHLPYLEALLISHPSMKNIPPSIFHFKQDMHISPEKKTGTPLLHQHLPSPCLLLSLKAWHAFSSHAVAHAQPQHSSLPHTPSYLYVWGSYAVPPACLLYHNIQHTYTTRQQQQQAVTSG